MKKILCALICVLLVASIPVKAEAAEAPVVSARTAVLMDADSGEVLYEKDADEPMLIASTTKIMTALIVLEHCDVNASVVIEPAWTGIEGSSMYLAAGQELTVEELLYGLLLASGNDAAVALACVAAGSVEAFSVLMNEKADALGCENTHFENPNGLDGERHHSSARDMALITRAAIENETFRRIVSSESVTVGELTYLNHNRLLWECDGVFGVKTGYTQAAGRTLVSSCERKGVTLICVTLSAPNDWEDHSALYDWGFDQWTETTVVTPEDIWTIPVIGGTMESVSVYPAEEITVFSRRDEDISLSLELPRFVYASVQAGDTAGVAAVSIGGETVEETPIIFSKTIEKREAEEKTILERLVSVFRLTERKIYTLS